jgi:hypothetical protein
VHVNDEAFYIKTLELNKKERIYSMKKKINCCSVPLLHRRDDRQLLLQLAQVVAMLVLFLLDVVQSVGALLQLFAYEIDSFSHILLALYEALFHEDRPNKFEDAILVLV